jgi:hypothetical protein
MSLCAVDAGQLINSAKSMIELFEDSWRGAEVSIQDRGFASLINSGKMIDSEIDDIITDNEFSEIIREMVINGSYNNNYDLMIVRIAEEFNVPVDIAKRKIIAFAKRRV